MLELKHIPTNLITGLLGVGKTSAILDLLQSRSEKAPWAVLVNEFGDIPIDQAIFSGKDDAGVFVREVPGGCLCCSVGVPLQIAVVQLVRQAKPERLLIELSGMGHPGMVLDMLRHGHLANALDLKATLCLVDPRDVEDTDILDSQIFQDQVHLSDVLVINKTDLSGPDLTAECQDWAKTLFPAKGLVAVTQHGRLDASWLDLDTNPLKTPLFPEFHDHERETHSHTPDDPPDATLSPGKPYRKENRGLNRHTCGWIFSSEDVFDRNRLMGLLSEHDTIERLKGVFQLSGEWVLFNRVREVLTAQAVGYRRDSRVEIISRKPIDWIAYETQLIHCLKK
ncbi:MAG: GTP-binding protein [bacterium]|nr:GTP-binding protein [bacterium]